jgi:hypothetical protein
MDIESLKEQFVEQFKSYKSQIEDSESYIKLKEGYDKLTPNVQALLKAFGVFLVLYFFYSIPASYTSSAEEKMSLFEENREITRDLIRAGRIAKTTQLPPPAPSPQQLTSNIERNLKSQQVLPEQKLGITPMQNVASKSIVPKSIEQSGIKASLKKLNLRQVIKLGEDMNEINSSQLMNMVIQADSKDPHYYNVDYEIASFSVPRDTKPAVKDKKNRSRFGNKKKK